MSDVDYLASKAASEGLAQQVRAWWQKRGYSIKVDVFKERHGTEGIWVLRLDYSPNVNVTKGLI